MTVKIAVVGAGVIGISTAVNIQSELPDAKVTIFADKFYSDTTSYGSAGSYLLTIPEDFTEEQATVAKRCAVTSWSHFRGLAVGPQAAESGLMMCTGYRLKKTEAKYKLQCVLGDERVPDEELRQLGVPDRFKYGYKSTTVIADMRRYLNWLMKKFTTNGGEKEEKKLQSLEELVGQWDVAVNCSGYGSHDLLSDKNVVAGRGVIVRVKAPWVKHWFVTDETTYMFPGIDYVCLGGCKQMGNTNLEVSDEEIDDIVKRCEEVFPYIKGAEYDHAWAGLRPVRNILRLEQETISFKSGDLQVVHNYGHGTDGVGASWGTALEATQLVLKTLRAENKV